MRDGKRWTIRVRGFKNFYLTATKKTLSLLIMRAKNVNRNATEQLQTDRWGLGKSKTANHLGRKTMTGSSLCVLAQR